MATKRATAEIVLKFMCEKIIPVFGAPRTIISDNATCFTAKVLQDFMSKQGIRWHTVLAYAPMSNGKAERMVGTIKRSIGRIVAEGGKNGMTLSERSFSGFAASPCAEVVLPLSSDME